MNKMKEAIITKHHNHNEEADNLWKESSENEMIKGLNTGKDISELLSEKKLAEVFKEAPCCLGCSDGRIHDHRLGRAGMGILAGVEATVDALKEMIDNGELVKEGLTITSHTGCGAAKIVCNKMIAEGTLPADTDPDDLGIDFAVKVAQGLNEKGVNAEYRHIGAKEMDEWHDERGVYLDGTGKINIETAKGEKGENLLPRGFIFSDLDLDKAVTISELKALCRIARGDHGFGNRFDKENPFYIFISAKDDKQYEELKSIADEVTKDTDGVVKPVVLTIG